MRWQEKLAEISQILPKVKKSGRRKIPTMMFPFGNFYVKYEEPNWMFWHIL
jgi:hypothetical protein